MKFFFLITFFISSMANAQTDATCLKTYDRHYKAANAATVTIGAVGIAGSAVAIALTGPFGVIPLAISGGAAVTAYYYKKQYEKAWFLLKESSPRTTYPFKYINRISKNSGLNSNKVAKIIWKNEAKFCQGKLPWTYRKIRKAIKKRKLTL